MTRCRRLAQVEPIVGQKAIVPAPAIAATARQVVEPQSARVPAHLRPVEQVAGITRSAGSQQQFQEQTQAFHPIKVRVRAEQHPVERLAGQSQPKGESGARQRIGRQRLRMNRLRRLN